MGQTSSVRGKPFNFHQWCVGSRQNASFQGNDYAKKGPDEQQFVFKTLGQTMGELGHKHIDLLKFDIEGFEWDFFEHELLPHDVMPLQLSFELHTENAKPQYVPEVVKRGKNYQAVNRLFLALHDKGYRVVAKELNNHDRACCEFVLVNVDALRALREK